MGTGALNRRLPTGGFAKGTPSHFSVFAGEPEETPRKDPEESWTTRGSAWGAADSPGVARMRIERRPRVGERMLGVLQKTTMTAVRT